MSDLPSYNDLAVRCARLEIERDNAVSETRQLQDAHWAMMTHDEEYILDKCRLVGIPVRDLRDIFQIVGEWRAAGGRDEWLSEWRLGRQQP